MKLIRPHGQPHYGRFKEAVSQINLEDYRNPFLANPLKKKYVIKNLVLWGFSIINFQLVLRLSIWPC